MKLEYHNGVRTTKMYHELSPFEAAIARYEEMAEKHFDTIKIKGKLNAKQAAEKAEALAYLAAERRKLDAIASVQGQLEEYRERGLDATRGFGAERVKAVRLLRQEAHHPTSVLESYMFAEGQIKPSRLHTAHHIVPGTGKVKEVNARTRAYLHSFGIRINDPANGVYLLHKDEYTPHWSMPESRGHLKYHTKDYERWVSRSIRVLSHIDTIKTQLQIIGRLLQQHEPKTVIPKATGVK